MLPPHTTHLTQPLDVGLFSPLQHYYSKAVDSFMRAGGLALGREDFEILLDQARDAAYTAENIKSAWRKAGLIPFNRRVLLDMLKRPEPAIQSPISIDTLPKTTGQLRRLAAHGRHLADSGDSPTRLKAVLNQLEATAQVAAAEAAIHAHEASNIKKQLNMKKNWKKSQARLKASPNKHGITWTRPQIDRALIRQREKEQEAERKRLGKRSASQPETQVEHTATASILDEDQLQLLQNGMFKFQPNRWKGS